MASFNDYDPLPPNATLQQRVQRMEAYIELMDRNFGEAINRMLAHRHPEYEPRRVPTRSSSDFAIAGYAAGPERPVVARRRDCCATSEFGPHDDRCDIGGL